MHNIKMSTCLGIIGSLLITQLLQKILKQEEEILLFDIIITGFIQSFVKVFFSINQIPCACKACVAQLDKYWLPNCDPSSQPRYERVKTDDIKNT